MTKTYLNFVWFREPTSKILTNMVFTVALSEPLTHCKPKVDFNHKERSDLAATSEGSPRQECLTECDRLHHCTDHQQRYKGASINSDAFNQRRNQQHQRLTFDDYNAIIPGRFLSRVYLCGLHMRVDFLQCVYRTRLHMHVNLLPHISLDYYLVLFSELSVSHD